MTTASARTNQIGHTISSLDSGLSGIMCKTDHLKISSKLSHNVAFHDEVYFNISDGNGHDKGHCIGDLLNINNNDLQRIGESLFSEGVSLITGCVVMRCPINGGSRHLLEVWTSSKRFKVVYGRVYGHRLETLGAQFMKKLFQ